MHQHNLSFSPPVNYLLFSSMRFLTTSLLLAVTLLAGARPPATDTVAIKQHLIRLTKTSGYRNHQNIALLNQTAQYIYNHFKQYADTVFFQEYPVKGKIYKNVVARFGIQNTKTIVVGAHYDVCGDQEGADDNASGVTALLELSRMLYQQPLNHCVELVAYTLEEPPYFEDKEMGSYQHAEMLHKNNAAVYGMISVEMIGYYRDVKNSQGYPAGAGFLKYIYGNKGNFITLVRKFGSGKFANKFCRKFKRAGTIKTVNFKAPASMPGINLSDHLNYWHFGYSALMITDTSFFRNKNYHEKTDTLETLDIKRMAGVIDGLCIALLALH